MTLARDAVSAAERTQLSLLMDNLKKAIESSQAALSVEKTARVAGLSSSALFDRIDPCNPINRRISIIVMTHQAELDVLKTDSPVSLGAAQPVLH